MADDYLVMARVMERELNKWWRENVRSAGLTGMGELMVQKAYKDAFMAGFYLKFTKNEER